MKEKCADADVKEKLGKHYRDSEQPDITIQTFQEPTTWIRVSIIDPGIGQAARKQDEGSSMDWTGSALRLHGLVRNPAHRGLRGRRPLVAEGVFRGGHRALRPAHQVLVALRHALLVPGCVPMPSDHRSAQICKL